MFTDMVIKACKDLGFQKQGNRVMKDRKEFGTAIQGVKIKDIVRDPSYQIEGVIDISVTNITRNSNADLAEKDEILPEETKATERITLRAVTEELNLYLYDSYLTYLTNKNNIRDDINKLVRDDISYDDSLMDSLIKNFFLQLEKQKPLANL